MRRRNHENLTPATGYLFTEHEFEDGLYTIIQTITYPDATVTTFEDQFLVSNVAASVNAGEDQAVDEGQAFTLESVTFADPGIIDTHTATIDWGDESPLADGNVTEDSGQGAVTGSHAYADSGIYTVTVTVTDDAGAVARDTLRITVNNVDPVAVLSNDGPINEGSEVLVSVADVTDPSLTDTDRGFRYSFALDAGDLATTYDEANDDASASFGFADDVIATVYARVFDKDDGYSQYSTEVTVNNVDPTASPDSGDANEDGPAIVIYVLTNDTDPAGENDPLTISGVGTEETIGLVSFNAGNVTYDPNGQFESLPEGQTVTDSFTYTIDDGDGGTATGVVSVTITGQNDLATIDGNNVGTMTEDEASVGGVMNVSDRDDDEDIFQMQTETEGLHGSFSIDAGGNWTYTPAAHIHSMNVGDEWTDSFAVTSFDRTATETVVITITGTNDVAIVDAADVTGAVTELVTPTGNLTDTGTIGFTDVDLNDVHNIDGTITASAGALGTFTASVTTDTTGSGTGWRDHLGLQRGGCRCRVLGKGETKVETFNITLG